MTALDDANVVRLARAAVRRDLYLGRVDLAYALAHESTQTMGVYALLCCLPPRVRRPVRRVKPPRSTPAADALFAVLGVAPLCRVCDLTLRQRRALLDAQQREL